MNKPPEPKSKEALAFTELAKKLVAVPKKEADEEKAKYEKQKEQEKGRRAT